MHDQFTNQLIQECKTCKLSYYILEIQTVLFYREMTGFFVFSIFVIVSINKNNQ